MRARGRGWTAFTVVYVAQWMVVAAILVGVGVAVGCGVGLTPGVDRAELPFHENPMYPPSGTRCPWALLVA